MTGRDILRALPGSVLFAAAAWFLLAALPILLEELL